MRSCMEVAKYLDESPQHMIPIQVGTSEADIQEMKDKHRLSRKHVAHMLNAVVLEIAIKVIWELDNNQECRYTHDIGALYGELKEDNQRELKEIYNEKATGLDGLEGTDKRGKRIRLGDLVQLQSLQEALAANEGTMRDFKYDAEFKGKSSAMGSVLWDGERLWTLPPITERFPEALYRYTADRVQKAEQIVESSD